ncbi:hypothetical protein PBI_THONKO_82 [Mycobacterium phage Thonko]|uniref:Uncharacterized protein n=1 Tax=Mycobacterium phage Thonko TaxID=2282910 RepID=A0A346FCC8_9CAUD|nr:hypothetical protein I5G57_gp082 [Mycobacterium phage Thonko]AXN53353.1 hypothetical protein PBI_THONKO_82 [Mycobacterium phage Thonko]
MHTLTVSPIGNPAGTVVTEHADEAAARADLDARFGRAYGITDRTLTVRCGRVAQASYTYVIRDETGRAVN